MTLLSANFQDLIDEQEAEKRSKRKKKKKMKRILIWKFNPDTGQEEQVEIETPDSGTFKEMYERYGNDYRYFCAMFPPIPMPKWDLLGGHSRPFKLFPDPEKAKEELKKNPSEYPYSSFVTNELLRKNRHLNPLLYYWNHTAWIDTKYNCILVERAGAHRFESVLQYIREHEPEGVHTLQLARAIGTSQRVAGTILTILLSDGKITGKIENVFADYPLCSDYALKVYHIVNTSFPPNQRPLVKHCDFECLQYYFEDLLTEERWLNLNFCPICGKQLQIYLSKFTSTYLKANWVTRPHR